MSFNHDEIITFLLSQKVFWSNVFQKMQDVDRDCDSFFNNVN